jgi:hypothetical protein
MRNISRAVSEDIVDRLKRIGRKKPAPIVLKREVETALQESKPSDGPPSGIEADRERVRE